MADVLQKSLTLPCGVKISNRVAKAAMTEGMADVEGQPTPELERLYSVWSESGAGLLLTGNIMIDRDHIERPGNVVIASVPAADMKKKLSALAEAATKNGAHLWGQISHAGRQTQAIVNKTPNAPSAIPLRLPGGQFGKPVAMTKDDIDEVVKRFGVAAKACKAAGFTGVQVHSAHGYLLAQFLSPLSNKRTDEYGGSLENRARVLLACVASVRKAVGKKFPVAVKLNSADFQRGGFEFKDCLVVVEWLEKAGVDLIEISGGNYEQPKLLGLEGMEAEEAPADVKQSTREREAYFVDFALAMRDKVKVPLMVTGGFRTRAAMEHALSSGAADLIGLGRPMCTTPNAPQLLFDGLAELSRHEDHLALFPTWLGFLDKVKTLRAVNGFAVIFWFYGQLYAIGRTGKPDLDISVFTASKQVYGMNKRLLPKK